jgi:hypothetical protein
VQEGVAIRQLAENDAAMLRRAGLPTRVEALRAQLSTWREDRVVHSRGEANPEALGWAVPIHSGKQLLGSLSVVLSRRNGRDLLGRPLISRGTISRLLGAQHRDGCSRCERYDNIQPRCARLERERLHCRTDGLLTTVLNVTLSGPWGP